MRAQQSNMKGRAGPVRLLLLFAGVLGVLVGACRTPSEETGPINDATVGVEAGRHPSVPDWAADAIFYQIFPERFRNGDTSNDPTRETLELHSKAPPSWRIKSWTSDWYARDNWEKEMGDDFYNSVYRRRYGGDLQGILDELDYLSDLGINAIYFNPLFEARSLHKYDGNTYHHIDPHFGPDPDGDRQLVANETSDPATWVTTAADSLFFHVLAEAHVRGIRIILDGVFNHTGRDFFAFYDLRQKQEKSAYKDWYVVKSFDDPATPENEFDYEGWFGARSLPVFADTPDGKNLHPGPKQYVFDATRKWMDPNGDGDPSDGIDGWRLDVSEQMPVGFWREWNGRVCALNPDAYTVSERWDDVPEFLEEADFSATMNYYGFAFPVKGFLIDGSVDAAWFAERMKRNRTEHPPARRYAMMNILDSHDTDRLPSMIRNAGLYPYLNLDRFDYNEGKRSSVRNGGRYSVRKPADRDRRIQRLTVLFQFTYIGAPTIYYGTEAGLWGGGDPDDRKPMLWPEMKFDDEVSEPDGGRHPADAVYFDRALHDYYRDAVRLREDHGSLRRGSYRTVFAEERLLAFIRESPVESVLVVLNREEEPRTITVDVSGGIPDSVNRVEPPVEFLLLFDSETGAMNRAVGSGRTPTSPERLSDGMFRLALPALSGRVFVLRGSSDRK